MINSKMTKKCKKKKEINCKLSENVAENRDTNIFRITSMSRGYPVTQFQALKNSLAHRPIGNNFYNKFKK